MSKYQYLKVEHKDGIDIVTLNRPESLNALDKVLFENLLLYFDSLQDNEQTRVVILRGEGAAFCAGADIDSTTFESIGPGRAQRQYATQRKASRLIRLMRNCPQPIIALCHGAICGGGFSLILAADIRLAEPGTRMNAAYLKVGLSGTDMGSGYLLPRLIGLSVASELLLTGRFLGADRAKAIGLVSDVVAPDELLTSGLEIAGDMLLASPFGLRLTKDALNQLIDSPGLEAGLAIEDRQQTLLMETEDHGEAIASFKEKRLPSYSNK